MEISEFWKIFLTNLFSIKIEAYTQILRCVGVSGGEKYSKNVLKMVSGQSTLKNEFFPKIFFSSYGAFKTTCSYFFLGRNIHWVALESVLKIFTKNLQSATKCIKYQDIHIFRNKIWFSIRICQNFWDPPTQIFIFSNISKTRGQNFLTKNSNSA